MEHTLYPRLPPPLIVKNISSLIGFVPLSWCDEWLWGDISRELNGIGKVGRNEGWDGSVSVIGTPHGDYMIAGFV